MGFNRRKMEDQRRQAAEKEDLLELRVAFHNAVSRFQDWTADVGEPKVKLCGRFCPISEVCHEVANLFTPVPEAILSILYKETHASDDILALKIDQTYRARHGDDAEDSHRRSSCDLMSAGPDSSALRGFASGAGPFPTSLAFR